VKRPAEAGGPTRPAKDGGPGAGGPGAVLLDGEIVADGRITLDAGGALVAYGEGLFETLPVLAGRPRFLAAHLRRLDGGCRALGLGSGPHEGVLQADVAKLSSALGSADFSLRISIFRDGGRVRRLLVPSPLPDDVGSPVAVGIVGDSLNGPRSLATLKTSNYLVPRLAHAEGVARGFDEVLFTLPDGTVLEGTRSSVFMVADGAVITAPLSLPILPGVTREVILTCARKDGIPVAERPFTLAELVASGEGFISASVRGLRPVRSVEGVPLRRVGGSVSSRIAELYRAALNAG
jgi:branched-subunit amino acid aminotransferase/4-amino-4-deoxychorismate lyase